MSKRNKIIDISLESQALKKLRVESGLGIRKLADLMDLSHTRVHQMETGRDEISFQYIEKFLNVLNLDFEIWNQEIGKNSNSEKVKLCVSILKDMNTDQLDLAYRILCQL